MAFPEPIRRAPTNQDSYNPPVATLPWILFEPSNLRLEQTKYFKERLANSDPEKTKFNVKLYRFLNDIFPYYLPARYHAMDCVALSKNGGNYWAHASHFVFTNQMHGVLFWKGLELWTATKFFPMICHDLPYISFRLKSELFNHNSMQLCKSAPEFLFEPWLLLQLPWHPLVLQQWGVAALAAHYNFMTECVELYRWPLPKKLMAAVDKLLDISYQIPRLLCQIFLSYFSHFSHVSDNTRCQQVSKFCMKLVMTLAPFFKFIIGDKARALVRALKRMAWTLNFKCKETIYFVAFGYRHWDYYNDMFAEDFWKTGKYHEMFGSAADDDENEDLDADPFGYIWKEKRICGFKQLLHEVTPEWLKEMKIKYGSNKSNDEILKFVIDDVSKNGVIVEITMEDLFRAVDMFKSFFEGCYYHLMELSALIEGGLHKDDLGIMYTIHLARTKYKIADIRAAMIFKLFDTIHMWKCEIRLNSIDTHGPHMTFKDVNMVLEQAWSGKMTWTSSLRSMQESCVKRPSEIDDDVCPDLEKFTPPEAVKLLENRIKRLVLTIADSHDRWEINQAKLNPDWQFIQYILPCFVASFLDLSQNSDVDFVNKQKYLRFVHELVKGFEKNPYKTTNVNGALPGGYSPYQLSPQTTQQTICWQDELIQRGLYNVLNYSKNNSYEAVKFLNMVHKNFFSVYMDCFRKTMKDHTFLFDEATENLNSLYLGHMHYLNSRVLNALKVVTPESLVNIKALEIYVSMGIFMCDHFARDINSADYTGANVKEDSFSKLIFWEAREKVLEVLPVERYMYHGFAFQDTTYLENVAEESGRLNIAQLFAVMVYHCFKSVAGKGTVEMKGSLRVPRDLVEDAFFACRSNDLPKLQMLLAKLLNDEEGDNIGIVPYLFAKIIAPNVYKEALKRIVKGRVKMEPCEVTLIPIKHCRYCGTVDTRILSLCRECNENRDYPDRNWFCSKGCESKALSQAHLEEHARHYEIALGIEQPRVEFQKIAEKRSIKKQSKKKSRSGRR